jgi:hypothetical protein
MAQGLWDPKIGLLKNPTSLNSTEMDVFRLPSVPFRDRIFFFHPPNLGVGKGTVRRPPSFPGVSGGGRREKKGRGGNVDSIH